MISKFDKKGIRERFKKQFAECENDCDYEGAIDYLLKYSAECDNPSFHLACGTLYLQMTQDSDDTELYGMAYREFMMHIRRFPDCTAAYRNLIAVLFLRGDYEGAIEMCMFVKKRGLDLKGILAELAEVGLLFISADAPANIDDLLKPGDYGDIDMLLAEKTEKDFSYAELTDAENPDVADCVKNRLENPNEFIDRLNGLRRQLGATKILKFSGKYDGEPPKQSHGRKSKAGGEIEFDPKIADGDYDEYGDGDYDGDYDDDYDEYDGYSDDYDDGGDVSAETVIDNFHRMIIDEIVGDTTDDYRDGDYGADEPEEDDSTAVDFTVDDITIKQSASSNDESDRAVRAAMIFYDAKRYDRALAELDKIDRNSPQYYFALTVRALIEVDTGKDEQAETTLKKAVSLYPERALANVILSEYYEKRGKTDKIPQLLKQTDVKDYINAEYVYKAFRLARNYCSPEDAANLIAGYIEEYNIFAIRIIYAQMLYNTGAARRATDELYTLSRVFYDDFNANYFYMLARMKVEKMPVEDEAPQTVISAIVENILSIAAEGELDEEETKDDLFKLSLEFFVTLEFENSVKLLKEMFGAVRFFTNNELTAEKMTDTLVAPYAEHIVKATILAEQLAADPERTFLADNAYRPISNETLYVPKGYSRGYYRALAFAAFFFENGIKQLTELADELKARGAVGVNEYGEAYYLLRKTAEALDERLDNRIAIAVGCESLAAANRAYSKLCGNK